jgi:hypothetical protein
MAERDEPEASSEPETTLESMFAYQDARRWSVPQQRRTGWRTSA